MEKEDNKCTSTTTPCECGEKKPSKFKTVMCYVGTAAISFVAGVFLAGPTKKGFKKLTGGRGAEQQQPQYQQRNNSYGK